MQGALNVEGLCSTGPGILQIERLLVKGELHSIILPGTLKSYCSIPGAKLEPPMRGRRELMMLRVGLSVACCCVYKGFGWPAENAQCQGDYTLVIILRPISCLRKEADFTNVLLV